MARRAPSVAAGRPSAEEVMLVVPVEMDLECLAVPIATVKQFLLDVCSPAAAIKVGTQSSDAKIPLISVGFNGAGPAHHCRHPIAAFPTLLF
jgi:hypothetical protein